jgi:hypothetical protein
VDDAKGGWGHLNVDHIVQTDRKPPGLLTNAERQFTARARYLHLPIKNGAPKRVVTLLVDGQRVVRNDIELADGQADWWAPMDVSAWRGKSLTLRVDKLPEDSTALSAIEQSDELKDADDLYREPLRGQFHFSPRRGWNNDPNGLVFSTANTTSSSSTTPTAGAGGTCTGVTPSAATWCIGRNWATNSSRTTWAPCSAAARSWTGTTPAALARTASRRWCCSTRRRETRRCNAWPTARRAGVHQVCRATPS